MHGPVETCDCCVVIRMIYSVRRRSIQPHGLHRDSVYQHTLEGGQIIAFGCLPGGTAGLAVVLTVARSGASLPYLQKRGSTHPRPPAPFSSCSRVNPCHSRVG